MCVVKLLLFVLNGNVIDCCSRSRCRRCRQCGCCCYCWCFYRARFCHCLSCCLLCCFHHNINSNELNVIIGFNIIVPVYYIPVVVLCLLFIFNFFFSLFVILYKRLNCYQRFAKVLSYCAQLKYTRSKIHIVFLLL